MKIRNNYTGADFKKIVQMLKVDQPFLGINEKSFTVKVLCEENFSADGFFIAEEGEEIKGFINTVWRRTPICPDAPDESKNGYISLFCIPEKRDVDTVGKNLLTAVQEHFKKLGKTHITTAYFPTYFSQGFSEADHPEYINLFAKQGYSSSRSFAIKMELADYEPDEAVEKKRKKLLDGGFYIGALTEDYVLQLINPKAPFSNPSWSYEIKQRVIYNDFSKIRIAAIDGKLIGAAPFCDPFGFDGRFGPFGVDPAFRGYGIGSVLFADCLTEMKKQGVKTARMQWVAGSGAAYHIYEKSGFKKDRTFITMSKEL